MNLAEINRSLTRGQKGTNFVLKEVNRSVADETVTSKKSL